MLEMKLIKQTSIIIGVGRGRPAVGVAGGGQPPPPII